MTGNPLISSDRVQGTEVYAMDGNHIGEIQNLMIDKVSGRVAYAVMTFGGFLGMGESRYPIPWSKLTYDVGLGGYRTDLTEDQVRNSPQTDSSTTYDQTTNRRLYDYSGARGWWV